MQSPESYTKAMTVEDYLIREEKSEIRHEFYNGQVYAMAGGTVNHNRLIRRVSNMLEGQPSLNRCGIFSENIKVDVMQGVYMPYPDVVVTCHPFDLRGDNTVVRQPRLLIEVLSKSTASHDRGFKWLRYRRMPSLWYYMLIDQYTMTVELFSRIEETDEWINTIYEHPNDILVLPRLNCELPVNDIYADIELIPDVEDDVN